MKVTTCSPILPKQGSKNITAEIKSKIPKKPTITAIILIGPIDCRKKKALIKSTKIGAVNRPANASANGTNARLPK